MNTVDEQLLQAVAQGDVDAAQRALDAGACVNAVDTHDHQRPALSVACSLGHMELVKLLLAHGADLESCDKYSWTPLHWACRYGKENVALYLLDCGANAFAKTDCGETALMWACISCFGRVVNRLLELGADPFDKDIEDCDALSYCGDADVEMVRRLTAEGLTHHASYSWDEFPLYCALNKGNTEVAKLLIEQGADCKRKNHFSESTVAVAIRSECWELLPILLRKGASAFAPDDRSRTPLMHLVAKDEFREEAAELLLQYGACLDGMDDDGKSALRYAATPQAEQWLRKHGAGTPAVDEQTNAHRWWRRRLGLADDASLEHLAELLLQESGRALTSEYVGYVLGHAVSECCLNHDDACASLIRKDAQGRHALLRQCMLPDVDAGVVQLLRNNMPANECSAVDSLGNTALWYALRNKRFDVALGFARGGVDEAWLVAGQDGKTPLQMLYGAPAELVRMIAEGSCFHEPFVTPVQDDCSVLDRAMLDAYSTGRNLLARRLVACGARSSLLPERLAW